MPTEPESSERRPVRVLIFAASLRRHSLNDRLATLAASVVGEDGRLANATLQRRFETTIACLLDLVEAAKHYRALKKQWVEFLGERPAAAIDRVEHTSVDAR